MERDTQSESSFEDEEAFLDPNDPDNVVVDDGTGPDPEASSESEKGDDPGEEESIGQEPEVGAPRRDDAAATFDGPKPLHCVSCLSSRGLVAVGSEDDSIQILSWVDGVLNRQSELREHSDTVTHVAFSPNGAVLATGAMDGAVILWDVASWTPLHKLTDLSGEIESVLWHPSSLLILAAASDAQVGMWNASKGTLAQYFVGHTDSVTCLAWSVDVKKLFTASADATFCVFNPKTGEAEVTCRKGVNAGISALRALSSDVAMCGCVNGDILFISTTSGKVLSAALEAHTQAIEQLALDESCSYIAACSCDSRVTIWNANDCTLRSKLEASEGIIKCVWRQWDVIGAGADGNVYVWDGRQSTSEPRKVLTGHTAAIHDISLLSAAFLVSASDDSHVKVFSLA